MISTIILNWNRAALLRKTVESYLETIKGGFELFIVDSASIDASHDYLRELDSKGWQPFSSWKRTSGATRSTAFCR